MKLDAERTSHTAWRENSLLLALPLLRRISLTPTPGMGMVFLFSAPLESVSVRSHYYYLNLWLWLESSAASSHRKDNGHGEGECQSESETEWKGDGASTREHRLIYPSAFPIRVCGYVSLRYTDKSSLHWGRSQDNRAVTSSHSLCTLLYIDIYILTTADTQQWRRRYSYRYKCRNRFRYRYIDTDSVLFRLLVTVVCLSLLRSGVWLFAVGPDTTQPPNHPLTHLPLTETTTCDLSSPTHLTPLLVRQRGKLPGLVVAISLASISVCGAVGALGVSPGPAWFLPAPPARSKACAISTH